MKVFIFTLSLIFLIPTFSFSQTNINKDKIKGGINTYSTQPFSMPRTVVNGMYNNFADKLNKIKDKNIKTNKKSESKSMADIIISNSVNEKTMSEKEYYKSIKNK